MMASERPAQKPPRNTVNDTILKALGRAYRWKWLLESGEFASIGDLAAAEKINHSYIRRILRLTLLSPEITEILLNGTQSMDLRLERLLKAVSSQWADQGRATE